MTIYWSTVLVPSGKLNRIPIPISTLLPLKGWPWRDKGYNLGFHRQALIYLTEAVYSQYGAKCAKGNEDQ